MWCQHDDENTDYWCFGSRYPSRANKSLPRIDRFFWFSCWCWKYWFWAWDCPAPINVWPNYLAENIVLCVKCAARAEKHVGEAGAVVSWFFDDQFVNGCRAERRRSLLLFTFHPSRGTSAKATMSCHGGLNEPSDRDGNRARLLPRISGMRCRGDARARSLYAKAVCDGQLRNSRKYNRTIIVWTSRSDFLLFSASRWLRTESFSRVTWTSTATTVLGPVDSTLCHLSGTCNGTGFNSIIFAR